MSQQLRRRSKSRGRYIRHWGRNTNLEYHFLQFHHCHGHPEALRRTMTENQFKRLVHSRQTMFVVDQPPFWPKSSRIIPKDPVKLCAPRVNSNECSPRNMMTVDRVSFGRHHTLAELAERRKFAETLADTSLEVVQLIHLRFFNGIPD